MSQSAQPSTRFLGSLTITPGSGSAYAVPTEEGNLNIAGLTADQREAIVVEHRGVFQTAVSGKQVYPTFTLTAKLRDLVDNSYDTLIAILLKRGSYSSATSTLGANRPWTVDILWSIDGTAQGDASDHTILLEDCRITDVSIAEADVNEVTISGTCWGTITMT